LDDCGQNIIRNIQFDHRLEFHGRAAIRSRGGVKPSLQLRIPNLKFEILEFEISKFQI